jgi:integrase
MSRALTDAMVRNVQPPSSGRAEIRDPGCRGLELRVTAAGVKSFAFRYRDRRTRRIERITLGRYPDLMLREARARADELRHQVANGQSPATDKRGAAEREFAALADRYLTEHARRFKRSADQDERNLRLHILPRWRDRDFAEITRADVVSLVERLAATRPVLANRVQALVSSIFSFAVDKALIAQHPCLRLRKAGDEAARKRVLDDDEIRTFWTRVVEPPVSRAVGLALRLVLLTGCRPGEIAGLMKSEIELNPQGRPSSVTIPAERSKNGRPHFVPLAPLARGVLTDALTLAGGSPAVFPSRSGRVAGHALAVAMARLGKALGAEDWPTPHDLRRTCATRLSKAGIRQEDVSAILNHTRTDVTGKHYDVHDRAGEKRIALSRWSQILTAILEPPSADNVVALRG